MFLAKLCPHDLFRNTKADLGSCGGQHDDDVKIEFDQLPPYKKHAYEDEFLRYAQVGVLNRSWSWTASLHKSLNW